MSNTEGNIETKKYPLNTHPANQPDEYVKCPYFPEHELRRSRLPYHLLKCQKNPHAPKLLACPFNYLHRVKPENQQDHLLLCEDRIAFNYVNKPLPTYERTSKELTVIKNARQTIEERFDRPQDDDDEEIWS